jgi:hypothetical protein
MVTGAGVLAAPAALATAPGTIQVTGPQLDSALLPPSVFGTGYLGILEQDSGPVLVSPANPDLAGISCGSFSVLLGNSYLPGGPGPGFGATAHATYLAWGNRMTHRSYRQAVYQFASSGAAASLFAQTYAKYAGCRSFSLFGVRFTLASESKTRVGGYQALQLTGTVAYTDAPPYGSDMLITVDGRDVFVLNAVARPGSSAAVATSAVFTLRLIARAQALRGSGRGAVPGSVAGGIPGYRAPSGT